MEKIDISKWERKELFCFFENLSAPHYNVTFRFDVTRLYSYVKANGLSFYYSMVYLCTKAINSVDAFRYVIKPDGVYKTDGRIPSFTDLKSGSETFYIVTMPCEGTLAEFNAAAKKRSAEQTEFIISDFADKEKIYFSCLPWLDITTVTHERDIASPENRYDSVPRITWGKFVEKGGGLELGMSVEVNHRLIDGLHIAEFAESLAKLISEL